MLLLLFLFVFRISTPPVPFSGKYCIQLWYYMFGSKIGELNVNKKSGEESTRLLRIKGSTGRKWFEEKMCGISMQEGDEVCWQNVPFKYGLEFCV